MGTTQVQRDDCLPAIRKIFDVEADQVMRERKLAELRALYDGQLLFGNEFDAFLGLEKLRQINLQPLWKAQWAAATKQQVEEICTRAGSPDERRNLLDAALARITTWIRRNAFLDSWRVFLLAEAQNASKQEDAYEGMFTELREHFRSGTDEDLANITRPDAWRNPDVFIQTLMDLQHKYDYPLRDDAELFTEALKYASAERENRNDLATGAQQFSKLELDLDWARDFALPSQKRKAAVAAELARIDQLKVGSSPPPDDEAEKEKADDAVKKQQAAVTGTKPTTKWATKWGEAFKLWDKPQDKKDQTGKDKGKGIEEATPETNREQEIRDEQAKAATEKLLQQSKQPRFQDIDTEVDQSIEADRRAKDKAAKEEATKKQAAADKFAREAQAQRDIDQANRIEAEKKRLADEAVAAGRKAAEEKKRMADEKVAAERQAQRIRDETNQRRVDEAVARRTAENELVGTPEERRAARLVAMERRKEEDRLRQLAAETSAEATKREAQREADEQALRDRENTRATRQQGRVAFDATGLIRQVLMLFPEQIVRMILGEPTNQTIVISGFPAVGKSRFQRQNALRAIGDKYENFIFHDLAVEPYALNALGTARNRQWPNNYIEDILPMYSGDVSTPGKTNVIFISTPDAEIIQALGEAGVEYVKVYPEKGLQREYARRFNEQAREGTRKPDTIATLTAEWDQKVDLYATPTGGSKYVLPVGEYLSGVMDVIIFGGSRRERDEREMRSPFSKCCCCVWIVILLILLAVLVPAISVLTKPALPDQGTITGL